MKNLFKIFALLFAMGILVVACDDVKLDEPEVDAELTEDNAFAAKNAADVFAAVNNGTSTPGKKTIGCETITYTPDPDATTYSMTITYSGDCVDDGVVKSGTINVSFSKIWEVNSVATIEFDNYTVNGVALSGTMTARFVSMDPTPVFEIDARNMVLTFEDDRTIEWLSDRTLTMLEGYDTKFDKSDDKWEIDGTSSGVSRNDKNFTRTETNLISQQSVCKWFTGGTVKLSSNDNSYSMTFSETCGEVAVSVTFANGVKLTKTINLN
jgi:hypothetical protein